MTEPSALVEAHAVTVRRGGREILRRVDLTLHEREIVTLIGPNGAGKSTLLKALLGLIPLDGGHLRRAAHLVAGYVPQRLSVDATLPLPVREFLRLSAPPRAPAPEPEAVMARLGCAYLLPRPLHALSGGETQRALLARALMRRPNLLVLDEPTQGVDLAGERDIYGLLDTFRRQDGMAVLLVSHDLHMVMAATDRVICLQQHICCSGTPTAVGADPSFRALFGDPPVPALGIYQHHHDHCHTLCGEAQSPPPPTPGAEGDG